MIKPSLKKLREKKDPGKFFISFSIHGIPFLDTMCNIGACMSVMSMVDADKLGLSNIESTNMSVRLADSSKMKILGIVYDLGV